MRSLKRNQREIWYALYGDGTPVVDGDGFKTGETSVGYSKPVKAKMNVSGGRGRAEAEIFGMDNPFTRSAVTDDMKTPFDTTTVFWFGKTPADGAYNYTCTGVADSLNCRVIALREVNVSE